MAVGLAVLAAGQAHADADGALPVAVAIQGAMPVHGAEAVKATLTAEVSMARPLAASVSETAPTPHPGSFQFLDSHPEAYKRVGLVVAPSRSPYQLSDEQRVLMRDQIRSLDVSRLRR